jgi:hypothetical protein
MDTTETNNEVAEATRILAEAISEYGRPVYIVKVPSRIQHLVPLAVRKELLANSKLSEGWVRDNDGCYYKGRPDNKSIILAWAKENLYQQVTTKDIAEATGVPIHTVRTVVGDRPDIFRESDGWTYEVRDPQADRKAEKK